MGKIKQVKPIRALVRILRSVGADFRFLNSLVSFINKDIEFLIKSVGAKAPFQKFVGAAAPIDFGNLS